MLGLSNCDVKIGQRFSEALSDIARVNPSFKQFTMDG